MQETWVWLLGWEDPPEEDMEIHSSILAGESLWTEEPGRLQSMGSQKVRHNWATKHSTAQTVSTKQKKTHRHREQNCSVPRGRGMGEGWIGSLGLEIKMQTIIHKMDKSKVLLYSTGGTIFNILWWKEDEKECIYMYNWITLLGSRN